MSFNNFLKTFNEFLLEQGGTTYLVADHYLKGKDKPLKSVFFPPIHLPLIFYTEQVMW